MTQRVAAIQAEGRDVVFITTNLPAANLLPVFTEAGVDLGRLHIVDAITPPAKAPDVPQTTFIGSPAMLELIGMRAERVAQRMTNAHLVMCCVNSLRMYNDSQDVDRFMHYLASRVRSSDLRIDFVVRPGPEAEALIDRADTLLGPLAKA